MISREQGEVVDDFSPFGVSAFTTTRAVGSFSTISEEAVRDVMARWDMVRGIARQRGVARFATATQVHGTAIVSHVEGWTGWLRSPDADGHLSVTRGTAMAVSIADCVPVFIAHPSGAASLLHSGWRGTAARFVEKAIAELEQRGMRAAELHLHLGPAVCGACYEVSADVLAQLTGRAAAASGTVDLRALIADQARAAGVRHIAISPRCTRHDHERFFSHRAGDRGRQVAVIFAES